MSTTGSDNIWGDPTRDKRDGPQTNTSRIRRVSPPRMDSLQTSAAPASNIGKAKSKLSIGRSAKTSREPSPTRSISTGSRAPQAQRTTIRPSASRSDLHQPRPPQPLPPAAKSNAPRLTPSGTPPPETQTSYRKKSEPSALHSVASTTSLSREYNDQRFDSNDIPPEMRTPRSNSSAALGKAPEGSPHAAPSIGSSRSLEDSVAALVQRQSNASNSIHSNIPEEGTDTDSASTVTRKDRRGSMSSSIAPISTAESESESGYKSEDKTPTKAQPPPRPFGRRPTVTGGKDGSSKAMIVETETVSSIPQVGLGAVGSAGGASIRSKKSTDTIRAPRKEKRRLSKKPSLSGPSNTSSRADIFAAKIEEAVDEVNSSDSEETFVYESNPLEPSQSHTHQRPTSRFHSRTPSATSIGPDPRGQRLPLLSSLDATNSTGRKGMKFVNNSLNKETNFGADGATGDGMGSGAGSGAGSSRENQARGNRVGGRHNGHPSILADDGLFARHKASNHSLRNAAASIMSNRQTNSRPPSPKHTPFRNAAGVSGGKRSPRSRVYEADVEHGDDENTPLVSTSRTRVKRRPVGGSIRQMEHNARRRGWLKTYAGCIVAVIAIVMILMGVSGFLVATTNALQGVKVLNVTDVLVSKQEIMLDLVVEAMNPNAIAVTIGSMDVNLFAKSSHVREDDGGDKDGGDKDGHERDHEGDWWELGSAGEPEELHLGTFTIDLSGRLYPPPVHRREYHVADNVDEGTDPPEADKETMLLGRIFSFDSVLTFEGSPIRRMPSISVGELRLAKPGNKTEEGGTARWERVLLHPFELIVRGVLKYQLPLSGRIRTAPISGSVTISPELGDLIED